MSTPAASQNGTPPPASQPSGSATALDEAATVDVAGSVPLRPRLSARWIVLGSCVGLMGSCLAGLYWLNRPAEPPPPLLTQQRLAEAWQRWRERGPDNYDVELDVQGEIGGKVVVQVREGEVTFLSRDGQTPSQKRTWVYWTIPNQLGVLETDLAHARDTGPPFGSETSPAVLRAEFDSEYGYPSRYQRLSLGGMGAMSWQITRFRALPD